MRPVSIAAVALLSVTAMTAAASKNSTFRKVQPCNLDSEASVRILDQLANMVQVYLGRAVERGEVLWFLSKVSNKRQNCETERASNISNDMHDVMIKSWAISLQGASPAEYVQVEEIERRLDKLQNEIPSLYFSKPRSAVKPAFLEDAFKNGLRRIKASAAAGQQTAKILEAMAQNHQEILNKLETGNQNRCNSSDLSNLNQVEETTAPARDSQVQAVVDSLPALSSSVRSAIQASYPPCANTSNLVEPDRLNDTLSLTSSAPFSHLSQPAIYSAILDAISTPSPLLCTQDYVRLAYKVLQNEESSSSGTKKEWAVLKSRFRDEVFSLFENKERQIMSVSKPGFGLFATNKEIPGIPQYACSVMRPTGSGENNTAFEFRLIAAADGAHFLVRSALTGTNFQLYHLCRTSECNEDQSELIIAPTEAFVLGSSGDMSSPLQFRFIKRDFGESCQVGTTLHWELPSEIIVGSFLISPASVSEVASPETLFYLA